MKRILLMVIRNLFLVPWMWCRLCYHAAHTEKYSLEEHFRMLRFIVKRANKGGNVIVKSYGAENLPEKDGFAAIARITNSVSGNNWIRLCTQLETPPTTKG